MATFTPESAEILHDVPAVREASSCLNDFWLNQRLRGYFAATVLVV